MLINKFSLFFFSVLIDGTACKDEIWYFLHFCLLLTFSHLLDWPPMACYDLWPKSCITSVMWWDSCKLCGMWWISTYFINLFFHIKGYDSAGAEPEYVEGPPPNTCQICPQGPQGFNGTKVKEIIDFVTFTILFTIFSLLFFVAACFLF